MTKIRIESAGYNTVFTVYPESNITVRIRTHCYLFVWDHSISNGSSRICLLCNEKQIETAVLSTRNNMFTGRSWPEFISRKLNKPAPQSRSPKFCSPADSRLGRRQGYRIWEKVVLVLFNCLINFKAANHNKRQQILDLHFELLCFGDTFFFFFFFMINSVFFFSSFSCPPLIIEIIYNNISS